MWKVGQPDYFCSCDHVQRKRVVCYGLFRQNEAADRRIIRRNVRHEERTGNNYREGNAGLPGTCHDDFSCNYPCYHPLDNR